MPPVRNQRRQYTRYNVPYNSIRDLNEIVALSNRRDCTSIARRNFSLTGDQLRQAREIEGEADEAGLLAELTLPIAYAFHILSQNPPQHLTNNQEIQQCMKLFSLFFLAHFAISYHNMGMCMCYVLLMRAITVHDIIEADATDRQNGFSRIMKFGDYPTIHSFSENYILMKTRFSREQLAILYVRLRIPALVETKDRHYWPGELVLLVSLYKLATSETWYNISMEFTGKYNPLFIDMFHWFIDHIYTTFYHKISGDSLKQWVDHESKVDALRYAIWNKMHISPNEIERCLDGTLTRFHVIRTPFADWRIFGFIDDKSTYTPRPGGGPHGNVDRAPRRFGAFFLQRPFWSGYFKRHGLKYQTVLVPNGMFGSVYGASLTECDIGVLNMSGLVDYLSGILPLIRDINILPSLFGDAIFRESETVTSRNFTRSEDRNQPTNIVLKRLNALRQCIELEYGLTNTLFKILSNSNQYSIIRDGQSAFRIPMVCFFLKNCHNCFNGSPTTSVFGVNPPSINEYLPLGEALTPYEDTPRPEGSDYIYPNA